MKTWELLNSQLPEYLEAHGYDLRRNFRCLNPAHEDRHPSMHYFEKANKVHCFSCGATYDLIDLVGLEYGLPDRKSAYKKACSLYADRSPGQAYSATANAVPERRDNTAEFLCLLGEYRKLKADKETCSPDSEEYAVACRRIPILEYQLDCM